MSRVNAFWVFATFYSVSKRYVDVLFAEEGNQNRKVKYRAILYIGNDIFQEISKSEFFFQENNYLKLLIFSNVIFGNDIFLLVYTP